MVILLLTMYSKEISVDGFEFKDGHHCAAYNLKNEVTYMLNNEGLGKSCRAYPYNKYQKATKNEVE